MPCTCVALALHAFLFCRCLSCAGLEEEFVYVGRLDNLGMSYLSLQALIDSTSRSDALAEETAVRAVALFDHEEVGSASAQGTNFAGHDPQTMRTSDISLLNRHQCIVRAVSPESCSCC